MKKPPKISFKTSAPGRYWYLFWIGKIIYEEGIFKVRYHFINTDRRDDMIRGYNPSFTEIHTLSIRTLSFLSLGHIYDSIDDILITPSDYIKEGKQRISVFAVANYKATNKSFSFLNSKFSPLNNDMDFENLNYFKFTQDNDYGVRVNVIMPIYVLCQYIFFKTSNTTFNLLNCDVRDLFHLRGKRVLEINKKKVGQVVYDNNTLDEKEAISIAPFLFMQKDSGIHSLNGLSNKLKSFFVKNENSLDIIDRGVYLDTEWPFSVNTNLEVQGKEFKVNEDVFFMTYRILDIQFNKKPLTVDEIKVFKKFANKHLKKGSSEQTLTIKVNRNNDLNTTLDNIAGNSNYLNDEKNIERDNLFDFNIPVELISDDNQDSLYSSAYLYSEENLSKATLNTYDSDPESEYIKQNFNSKFRLSIDRFDFVSYTAEKLNSLYNININYDVLELSKVEDKIYNIAGNNVLIVELNFNNNYFYLIDFERGSLGFISKVDSSSIIPFHLKIFIDSCLEELDSLKKNEYLWTRIKKKKAEFLSAFNIEIRTPLTHQVKGFKNIDEAVNHFANKIYKNRILRKIS